MGSWANYSNKRENYHLLSTSLWQALRWALSVGFICFPICAARGQDQVIRKIPPAWTIKRVCGETTEAGRRRSFQGDSGQEQNHRGPETQGPANIPQKSTGPSGAFQRFLEHSTTSWCLVPCPELRSALSDNMGLQEFTFPPPSTKALGPDGKDPGELAL